MSSHVSNLIIPGMVFSIFAVSQQWAFFDIGVIALGLNSFVVLVLFWFIFLHNRKPKLSLKNDLLWLFPLWIIGLSFALYENPWLKTVCIWLLPLLTAFICSYRALSNRAGYFWGLNLFKFFMAETIKPIFTIGEGIRLIQTELHSYTKNARSDVVRRIATGILILLPIAVLVLSLLGSADKQFSQLILNLQEILFQIIDMSLFWQSISVISLFLVFITANLHWNSEMRYKSDGEHIRPLDSIISGIVAGGISLIYALFVYVQLENVFIVDLPNDFDKTVKIVKAGFWQLVLISIINVVLFLWIYKKSNQLVENMLRVFVIASGLIVVSAAWRLFLYVHCYGFSYEKFFASYTVLFSLVVFVILVCVSYSKRRVNVARSLFLLALWFFSIVTILPVEKMVFHTNIQLSKMEDSRIDLSELTALSLDIASDVEQHIASGILRSSQWFRWKMNLRNSECNRVWYQFNVSAALNCRAI